MRWSGNAAAAYAGRVPAAGVLWTVTAEIARGPSIDRGLITRIVSRPFAAGSVGTEPVPMRGAG